MMEGDALVLKPGREDQVETVGGRLVDVVAGFVKGLWRTSYTVLTVDLKRATISYDGPPILAGRNNDRRAIVSATPHSYRLQQEEQVGWLQRSQPQARLKVMQVWDLSSKKSKEQEEEGEEPWAINLGIGSVFEVDKGHFEAKARLRSRYASLHLLPEPLVELRGKWPLGLGDLGINLRCRLPLKMDPSWQPRIMLNLFHTGGPSLRLTSSGLLLDDNVIELGKYTRLRIAAALEFPRELPIAEGDKPFKLDVRRVGLKARTLL